MIRAIEEVSEPYERFLTTRMSPSSAGMSSGTPRNFASDRSMTNRGGSAIEKVVKFGGFVPVTDRTTTPPSSFTETPVTRFRSWPNAGPAASKVVART